MIERVAIVGTGLIGASVGLALKAAGFAGTVLGWDANPQELGTALKMGALDEAVASRDGLLRPDVADLYVLATPVLPILDWMRTLAPVLGESHCVTDVGSTKERVCALARELYNGPGQARFLPGHPMAGKEQGGAALAESGLFRGAAWLFTPVDDVQTEIEAEWRGLVAGFGAVVRDVGAEAHDEVCAWVSHLPQMVSTALAALLEDRFAGDDEEMALLHAVGGRALRETTRLGASPYSMWRDVAMTNTEAIAETLLALEQRLGRMRENLRTPELREEFGTANRFRARGMRGTD